MPQARAKIGGEYGANGEWYEGGKFIATTDHAKRAPIKVKSMGKQEVAPYVWIVAPRDGLLPIRGLLSAFMFDRATGNYGDVVNETAAAYYGIGPAHYALRDAYNAGLRWREMIDGEWVAVQ